MNSPQVMRRGSRAVVALIVVACYTSSTRAQNTRPTTADSIASGEVVKMEAFNTSETSLGRYAEAMSATATKVPTELKELPISLQILNANAITDRKAQTVIDL